VKAGFVDTNGEWMKRRHFPFWYERINGGVKVKYVSLLCSAAVILFLLCLTVFADGKQDDRQAASRVTPPPVVPDAGSGKEGCIRCLAPLGKGLRSEFGKFVDQTRDVRMADDTSNFVGGAGIIYSF